MTPGFASGHDLLVLQPTFVVTHSAAVALPDREGDRPSERTDDARSWLVYRPERSLYPRSSRPDLPSEMEHRLEQRSKVETHDTMPEQLPLFELRLRKRGRAC